MSTSLYSAGMAGACRPVVLYMVAEDLNSGPQACVAVVFYRNTTHSYSETGELLGSGWLENQGKAQPWTHTLQRTRWSYWS